MPKLLEGLAKRSQDVDSLVSGAREAIEAGRREKRRLEGEIETIKTKVAKYRDQLMTVKTNKEYAALLHEIEEANALIRRVEDRILEGMEQEEKLGSELRAKEAERSDAVRELTVEKAKSAEQVAVLQKELAELEVERQQLRGGIERETLGHFDRVFNLRGGVAVVGVKGETCEGCRVRIRPQVLAEMRRRDRLHICDNCKRILYIVDAPVAETVSVAGPSAPGVDPGSDDS
ncbi:MAG: C4-type zinc ribbon domain-containing protein [Acidobacteriota bacterium]